MMTTINEPPGFDQYFKRVWDTRLICPRCKSPIFYGLSKRDKANRSGPNYAYACSCMQVTVKALLDIYPETPHLRLNRWEMLLDDLPPGQPERDFKRPDGQTKCVRAPLNEKPGVFDPASVKRGKVNRTKEWQHTLQIAIESVEKLLELPRPE